MKFITVAELEKMTPAEREATFEASKVRDLSEVPPEFLARIQASVRARIAEEETANSA